MIKEKVKKEIMRRVDEEQKITREIVDPYIEATISKKIVKIYLAKMSFMGALWAYDEEPAWGPNEEAIMQEIGQLEELQGKEFTEEEIEEIKKIAWQYAESKIHVDYEYPGGDLGRKILFAAFKDECSEEEFNKALKALEVV